LAVVEHRRGRVERERAVRLELAVVPAALRRPAQRDHVIGEELTEPRRLQNLLAVSGWHSRLGGIDLELDLGVEACGHRRSGPFRAIYACIGSVRQVSFWLYRRLPARTCHRCCHSFTDGTFAHVAGFGTLRGVTPLAGYSLGDVIADLGGGPRRRLARP